MNEYNDYLVKDLNDLCDEYLTDEEISYIKKEWLNFPDRKIYKIASRRGWLNLLKYGFEKGIDINDYDNSGPRVCMNAAKIGDLEMIIWARKNGFSIDYLTSIYAAEYGQLDILKWIKENESMETLDKKNICLYATRNNTGYINIFEWIKENNWENSINWTTVCNEAGINGHLHVLKWIKNNVINLKNDWDCKICYYAAKFSHLDIIKWAREENNPPLYWSYDVFSAATGLKNNIYRNIDNTNFHILEYLKNNGCPINKNAYNSAAYVGSLHIMKWIRENYPHVIFDDSTTRNAAEGGQLETLKWLRSNGCEMYVYACELAYKYKHYDVVDWLKDNGCECRGRFHNYK